MAALVIEDINYCPRCGSALTIQISFGRKRPTCQACGWIYFADPKVAVAVLIESENQVLLVRRANDPQRGLWTLPAGFVDAGEDPVQAGERECFEETGLRVRITKLIDVLSGIEHPRGAHIVIAYQGEIINGSMQPGDDVDQVSFFQREELPDLAFKTTAIILKSNI